MLQNPRILIVEDEKIIALDIQFILESFGYQICGVVSSGEECIKKASQTHPDLILMDIKLKGSMDGICAAKQIQSHHNIPVIYLTAYGDKNSLRRVDKTKPFGYISKPFEETELQFKIKDVLVNGRKGRMN